MPLGHVKFNSGYSTEKIFEGIPFFQILFFRKVLGMIVADRGDGSHVFAPPHPPIKTATTTTTTTTTIIIIIIIKIIIFSTMIIIIIMKLFRKRLETFYNKVS